MNPWLRRKRERTESTPTIVVELSTVDIPTIIGPFNIPEGVVIDATDIPSVIVLTGLDIPSVITISGTGA